MTLQQNTHWREEMNLELEKEIAEMVGDFDRARVTRFYQSEVDSEIAIIDYFIGTDLWVTLFEIYPNEFTRVNIAGRTLKELTRIIG
jgi:hypothetical protein